MSKKRDRVDRLLVERGLAESQAKAQALVLAGQVISGDQRVDKPGTLVDIGLPLRLREEPQKYVSRGGLKLEAALEHFKIDVRGLTAIDLGVSTGGFTDCLLQRGARKIFAVDVGYGQLHEKVRVDPRVVVLERLNARELSRAQVPEPVDLVVADVSFISLKLVLPPALALLAPRGQLVALVKPQFEAPKEDVGEGGVVRDPEARARAIAGVASFVEGLGLQVAGILDSPVPGPAGNVEALLYAKPRSLPHRREE